MKKFIVVIACLLSLKALASAEKPVKSDITKVTVFTQGAQVFRSAPVTLSPGTSQLVFSGISSKIKSSSIQAGGRGSFVVTDVQYRVQYPEPPKTTGSELPKEVVREITIMEDSLSDLGFRRDHITERLNALQLEKDMIVKNKLARSEGKSDSLPVLVQAMDFFHKKLLELNSQIDKTRREQLKNNNLISSATKRLTELRAYKSSTVPDKIYEPIHQVVVTVMADAPASGSVDISYMVSEAGWTPSYDLRASLVSEPVKITYKADVFQNTGENWDDVKIRLSTSNPNKSNIKPELPTWYISYFTARREIPHPAMARAQSEANLSVLSLKDEDMLKDKYSGLSPAESAANYSQLVETMANVEFDIKLNYSIPSDGVPHMVSVKSDELPATFVHYLVPKLESEAFLLARVTGWENLNLLPGKANLFYEGTYVGETVLNPSVINDTLDLAMGRDNGITVTRTRMPVKEGSKILGTEITKTITYELRIKNNKSKSIIMKVEDQVPVAQSKDIKVVLKDGGNAEYNVVTGLLKWDFSLDPKSYKSIKFTYEVTHNKDMPLSGY